MFVYLSVTAVFTEIMIILLLCVIVLLAVLVPYFQQVFSFRRHGIKHLMPLPLLGNMGKFLLRKRHGADDLLHLYNSFPEDRFVGRFEFTSVGVVIRDVELVKRITVKDFEHFLNHRNFGIDSFFTRTLFLLQGQEWRDMRSTLSPAFTSSKIRLMVPFMVEVGDQMIQSLKKQIGTSDDGYIDVDCKDLTTRYTNDVIASCAFGLKVNSHTDKDNKFFEMGKTATNFSFRSMLVFFVMMTAPKLVKILDCDVISKAVRTFFTRLVLDTMKEREMNNIVRHDTIHLLMEAKKGKISHEDVKPNDDAVGFATVEESAFGKKKINRVWKDDDLVAQALLFFFAGFESISSSISFLMYELAVNPDVQERLAQEIREHDVKNDGKFDFNSIQEMAYMDMVVSEVLRLWPPAVFLDRQCNRDYNMGKPNKAAEKDFILRKGSGIIIPTYAFHRDPQFYPDPEKFDPERFSEENRHKINPLAYMPFGAGPRNCIGSRFALCEVKVMIYQLLRHIELSPCEKTCIPAKLAVNDVNIRMQGGHWLRLRLRK